MAAQQQLKTRKCPICGHTIYYRTEEEFQLEVETCPQSDGKGEFNDI